MLTGLGALSLAGSGAVEVAAHWASGLRRKQNAHGALVYMQSALNGQLAFAVLILAGFIVARAFAGKLDRERRISFDNGAILYYYAAAQVLAGLALIHGFPRLVN